LSQAAAPEVACLGARAVREFLDRFHIDLIIPENALSIPMHLPLGMALTELIAETGIPTIAHHHDFSWEKPSFLSNACQDILKEDEGPSYAEWLEKWASRQGVASATRSWRLSTIAGRFL